MVNFFIYIVLFSLIIYGLCRIRFYKISFSSVYFPFLFRLAFGSVLAFFFPKICIDSWNYFRSGLIILDNLSNHTQLPQYMQNSKDLNLLKEFFVKGSPLDHLRFYFLEFFSAILSWFTKGNYYANLIIFNWIVITGVAKLYETICFYCKGASRKLVYFLLFYFPPLVLWTSVVHKDGLILSLIGFVFYSVYKLIHFKRRTNFKIKSNEAISQKRKKAFKYMGYRWMFFSLLLLLFILIASTSFLRSFNGLLLIFLIISWILGNSITEKKRILFLNLTLIVGFFIIFFTSSLFPDYLNLPKNLAVKRIAFQALYGNSRLDNYFLDGSLSSYIRMIPLNIKNVFFEPNIVYNLSLKNLLVFGENLLLYFVMALAILYPARKMEAKKFAFIMSIAMYVFLNYWIVGVAVPFLGAIVRYRVIFETLLLVILTLTIEFNNVSKLKIFDRKK